MLNTELDRAITDQTKANGIGWQTSTGAARSLLTFGGIGKAVDYDAAFTDRF
jgi:hypothetical protein